ncbi:ABC-type transport system involved in multi-copper enzyme maturation, permease component [Mycoplasmopsis columbinasalis]|uniref:ABC-type transport system involved in multi-copper enzyme maturation, permease component n=1 Tax=Mycoplasmopsis columbinasalis TaxID=114880 RepID=A0A449BAT8_9BACT|nr:ABC-type transport system involved in multi-copper enzyme maturation, permease component [Mycoplasmopsis columbinasalis]
MLAFIRLQFKIYFRQLSSYVVPLIFAFIYIILKIAFVAFLPSAEDVIKLFNTEWFNAYQALYSLILCVFFIATAGATVFYRYRTEGIEILLFSKPLSRTKIYYANILVTFICSVLSLLISLVGNLFSFLVVPQVKEQAWIDTAKLLAASLLAIIFLLAFASIVQLLVSLKVFQMIMITIPAIVLFVFSFIRATAISSVYVQTENAAVINMFVLTNTNNTDTQKQKEISAANTTKNLSTLNFIQDNSQYFNLSPILPNDNNFANVNEAKEAWQKSAYKVLGKFNIFEDFFKIYIHNKKNIKERISKKTFEPIEFINQNGEFNAEVLKEFGIDPKNANIFKIFNINSLKQNYFLSFVINFDLIRKTLSELNNLTPSTTSRTWDLLLRSYSLTDLLLSYTNILYSINELLEFQSSQFKQDLSTMYDKTSFSSSVTVNQQTYNVVSSEELFKLLENLVNSNELQELAQKTADLVFSEAGLSRLGNFKTLLTKLTQDPTNSIDEFQKTQFVAKFDELKQNFYKTFLNSLAMKIVLNQLKTDNLNFDFQTIKNSVDTNSSLLKYYQNSFILPIVTDNNISRFRIHEEKEESYILLVVKPLIFFTLMSSIGLIIARRKNYN